MIFHMKILHGTGPLNISFSFENFKSLITSDTEIKIPKTKHSIFITADSVHKFTVLKGS